MANRTPFHTPVSIKSLPDIINPRNPNIYPNSVVVRNCPHLGWFQAVETPTVLKYPNFDFESDSSVCEVKNLPKMLLRLDVTIEIKEKPIGGLIYADKLHFEGEKQ